MGKTHNLNSKLTVLFECIRLICVVLSPSRVDVAGVSAVGETPERNQSRTTSHLNRPKPSGRELAGTCTVAETMMSSFSASDSAGGGGSDRKKGELQHPGRIVSNDLGRVGGCQLQ